MEPRIERFGRRVPRAVEPMTGIGKRPTHKTRLTPTNCERPALRRHVRASAPANAGKNRTREGRDGPGWRWRQSRGGAAPPGRSDGRRGGAAACYPPGRAPRPTRGPSRAGSASTKQWQRRRRETQGPLARCRRPGTASRSTASADASCRGGINGMAMALPAARVHPLSLARAADASCPRHTAMHRAGRGGAGRHLAVLGLHDVGEESARVVVVEGQVAAKHGVEHHAEAPDVTLDAHGHALVGAHHLRRHVLRRALCHGHAAVVVRELGQAEIRQFDEIAVRTARLGGRA